jgi:tetratricopeptide (TPR) repeat protein
MERGDWAAAARLETRATPYAWIDAVSRFARAMGAARTGNDAAARTEIAELRSLRDKLAAAKDTYWSEQVAIQIDVASAWTAYVEEKKDEALTLLRKAADAEDATDKSAISPGPLMPARELLGEMLLAVNRPAEALKEFEATMKKEPNRFRATYFAATAASAAGDTKTSRAYFRQLVEICKGGDTPGRTELREARKVRSS